MDKAANGHPVDNVQSMTSPLQQLTFAEYLTYSDDENTRYELVEGHLVPMNFGRGRHRKIATFLNDEFLAQIRQMPQLWASRQMSVGLRSPQCSQWETSRIPDVMILAQEQLDSMVAGRELIAIHEPAPFFVAEVVSRSTQLDDYFSKPSEYALLGISEYWIIDPLQLKVTVCTLNYRVYKCVEFVNNTQIESNTFPNIELSAAQILAASR